VQGLLPATEYETLIVATAAGISVASPVLRFSTLPEQQKQSFRVLFDAAHGEAAGNSDWVIDDGERFASPASPSSPTDWEGAISSWGFELFVTGRYEIETLPAGVDVQFGSSSPQDLSNYDAFIVPEPNNPFSSAERNAIVRYVQSGGGLLLVGNHSGSDRDNDGFDAVEVLNQLMNQNGIANNVFGVQFDTSDIDADPANNLDVRQGVPVIDGPFGIVQQIGINRGSTMTLRAGGPAQAIGWDNGAVRDLNNVIAAVSSFGAGKVFLISDSSPADDGTGRPGNDNIFDSWNVPTQDNATLFLNAVAFVVGEVF
jgi:hypothetical protein